MVALFYFLTKILNLITFFFLKFLIPEYLIPDSLDTYFYIVLWFKDLIGTSFFDNLFSFQQFLGIYTFRVLVVLHDFLNNLLSDKQFSMFYFSDISFSYTILFWMYKYFSSEHNLSNFRRTAAPELNKFPFSSLLWESNRYIKLFLLIRPKIYLLTKSKASVPSW